MWWSGVWKRCMFCLCHKAIEKILCGLEWQDVLWRPSGECHATKPCGTWTRGFRQPPPGTFWDTLHLSPGAFFKDSKLRFLEFQLGSMQEPWRSFHRLGMLRTFDFEDTITGARKGQLRHSQSLGFRVSQKAKVGQCQYSQGTSQISQRMTAGCSCDQDTGRGTSCTTASIIYTLDRTVLVEGELRSFFSSSKSVPALLPHSLSSALFQIMLHSFAVYLIFLCYQNVSHSQILSSVYIPQDNNIKQSRRGKNG